MSVTSDLAALEEDWEALDSVPLHSPEHIKAHLEHTRVGIRLYQVI